MTDKPFLFLDVDDTVLAGGLVFDADQLEAKGRLPEHAEGKLGFDFEWKSYYETRNARVYLEPWLVDGLHELSRLYDIVWASAWGGRARQLGRALDLDFHYCLAPHQGDLGNYKGQAIVSFLNGYHTNHFEDGKEVWDRNDALPVEPRVRPFAWADDDNDFDEDRVEQWAADNGVAMLRIKPVKRVGLTREQLDELREFARACAAA
jgi:hypothetical protein